MFEIEVCVGERALARGEGRSKKEAEQQAAERALEGLRPNGD
jgi:dsRNA-specific ribonuclease